MADINMRNVFVACRAAVPLMREAGGGAIVNLSSISASVADPGLAIYNASKAWVTGFTRSLAVDHGPDGIRCNAVCPGSIKTAMGSGGNLPEDADFKLVMRAMPLDKPRGPEVVAALIAMLASEDGAHINGEEIRVDGGTLS